jgi:molybdate transport system permease protein
MDAGLFELLKSAAIAASLAFIVALPLAWWLCRSRSPLGVVARVALLIPVVLPSPAVTTWFGGFNSGLVGAVAFSIPFAVFPLTQSFSAASSSSLDAAASLGAGPWDRFFFLGLAPSLRSVMGAIGLCLARAMAELSTHATFGAGNRLLGGIALGLTTLALLVCYGFGMVGRRERRS